MGSDLQNLVRALESVGELVRVTEPVSPVLQISGRADRFSKARCPVAPSADAQRTDPEFAGLGGPAVLFENVEGSDFPVLINAFGSYSRMEFALGGRTFEQIGETIGQLVKPEPPRGIGEAIARARQFAPLLKIGPKRSKKPGVCQQVVRTGDEIDLTRLPMLRCWPHDGDFATLGYPANTNADVLGLGHPDIDDETWEREFRGRFITLAGVHTIHVDDRHDPKPKSHNIGMYRMQLLGKDRLAMHWHMHHDGAGHWRSWKTLGEPMPVAIALGGPAVLPYSATCPLPPGISELLMAGFLNGKGIKLCRAKTVPIWVPADSEIVIEGTVSTEAGYPGWDPRDPDCGELGPGAVFEGPFGDHTGFYSLPDRYPVMSVSAVTHRENAVYPTTVVGLPPQEDYFLGKATERIMLPLLKTIIPDIEDYHLPMFGAFHNCAAVKINKHYPLHARRVMHAVWGAGQMAWTKCVMVVDDSVNVHDTTAVLAAIASNCVPSRDLETVRGPLDILDHAAPRLASGTKIGFDATPKVAGEDVDGEPLSGPFELPTPEQMAADVEAVRSVEGVLDAHHSGRAPGWLFVRADRSLGEPGREGLGHRVVSEILERHATRARFVVVLGRDVNTADHHEALFHWLANSDASRDAVWSKSLGLDRVGFDATPKTAGDARNGQAAREWPPVLSMD
ncbi:MAG: 4-hydroxy-3-polyprenylbenzoate decarboxylase [Phycisphaerales bacterium]|jgi:4-hydroxy-3-polyprenylbenzoate decarboxylase